MKNSKKLSYHDAFLCTLVTFYRRNDLHQRPTPKSHEPADLLRIQRIYFKAAALDRCCFSFM